MSVTVEATYQNGAFKSAQPVSLPEGAKVRLVITPVGDRDALADQGTAESSDQGRPTPVFIWSKALYRARKAAQEFTKETHADY